METAKQINRTDKGEAINERNWPRNTVKTVETRKRDLVQAIMFAQAQIAKLL